VQQSVVRSWARPPWVQQLEALKTDMLPSQRMRLRARTVAGNVVGSSQNKTFDPPSFGIHVQPGMWDSTDDVPLIHIPSIKMFVASRRWTGLRVVYEPILAKDLPQCQLCVTLAPDKSR